MALGFGAATAIQGGLSFLAGRKRSKALEQYIAFLGQQAAPGLKARKALLGNLLPQLGKGSRTLTGAFALGKERLGRAGERSLARSRAFHGRSGNLGRGRGEETRSMLATREAQSRLSLDFASRQEQFKAGTRRELGALSSSGDQFAMAQGQGILAQGEVGPYQDFATLLSSYMGFQQAQKLFGSSGGAGANK